MKIMICTMLLIFLPNLAFSTDLLGPPPEGQPVTTPGTVEVRPMERQVLTEAKEVPALVSRFQQQKNRGWISATTDESEIIDHYFVAKNPMVKNSTNVENLLPDLNMTPSDLAGTALETATLVSAIPAGGYVDGGWTGLVRVFSDSELGDAVLVEYDYQRAGSHVFVPEEAVDHYVGGFPVSNFVWRGPERSFTETRWFTETKDFTLMFRGEVPGKNDIAERSLEQSSKSDKVDQIRQSLR